VSVVLVDVRPRAAYAAGHIPGAVHLDPEADLSAIGPDPAHGGRHPLPDDDSLEAVFAGAGLGPASFVLAVDDGSGWAARCWWLLRHLGHDAAGTLDIRAYSGPLETDPSVPAPGSFRAHPRTDDTIGGEEILARLDDPTLTLLDARSRSRWLGDEEPLDPVAGRIPGALSTPFADPLPEAAVTAPEIVAYCGSGVTACVVAQKLVLAGREDVRLYPGSFSEWCRRASYPVQKGTA
jgi:thiosulfate/3-mercaptopyruvate sulfurtransferase